MGHAPRSGESFSGAATRRFSFAASPTARSVRTRPAPIVRWHGRRRIERFVERLYEAAKDEDPDGLVTYVNYPSTEYLQLPFVDFACFNVYLEMLECFERYLARLHNLAGDKPVVMA